MRLARVLFILVLAVRLSWRKTSGWLTAAQHTQDGADCRQPIQDTRAKNGQTAAENTQGEQTVARLAHGDEKANLFGTSSTSNRTNRSPCRSRTKTHSRASDWSRHKNFVVIQHSSPVAFHHIRKNQGADPRNEHTSCPEKSGFQEL